MSKASSFIVRRSGWIGLAAVVIALAVVPTAARARQRIDASRDATRLSIKHNWLGIAPPTKASVTAQPIVALPPLAAEREPQRVERRPLSTPPPAVHPVLDQAPDPPRGPPSVRVS